MRVFPPPRPEESTDPGRAIAEAHDWRTFLTIGGIFIAFLSGWFVGVHQQRAIAESVVQERQAPSGGPARIGEVTGPSLRPSPLPPEVEAWMAAECTEMAVASALQAAESFRQASRRAQDPAPVSLRALYAEGATVEFLKVLACLYRWDR